MKLPVSVASVVSLVLLGLGFVASFSIAIRLNMHGEPSGWVVDAVPPALSRVAFGHPRAYTSLTVVHDSFYRYLGEQSRSADNVNIAIARVLAETPTVSEHQYRLLGNDDKGIVLLTEFAFRIFGYKIESVFYLYYILLGTSVALFAYSYRENSFALLLASAFLLFHGMSLPMIKYNAQLGNLTALRCIPLLGMVACLHCFLFLFLRRISRGALLIVTFQVALIVLLVHIRSTAMWELALVCAASIVATFTHGRLSKNGRERLFTLPMAIFPCAVAVILMFVLHVHRAISFPDDYHRGDQILTRVIWHNIFSGLAFNPVLAERYEIRVDDVSVIRATGRYLSEQGREKEWEAMGGSSVGYAAIRWHDYDLAVRDMLFARCREQLPECLGAVFLYKPASLFGNLMWVWGLRKLPPKMELFVSPDIGEAVRDQFVEATRKLDETKNRRTLWLPRLLLIAMLFGALTCWRPRAEEFGPVLIASALLALGSLAPTFIGYPAPHTIAEAAVAIPLFLVLLPSAVFLFVRSRYRGSMALS